MEILNAMAEGRLRLPTELPSKRLYEVYKMSVADGVEGLEVIDDE